MNKDGDIKVELKELGGYVYVEKFRKGEEENRSKIFDENMIYLDYIDTEHLTQRGFNKIIENMKQQEHISDFLTKGLNWEYFTYSIFLEEVVDEIFRYSYENYGKDIFCKEEIDQIENDLKILSKSQFCSKYGINKIGMYFLFLQDV